MTTADLADLHAMLQFWAIFQWLIASLLAGAATICFVFSAWIATKL